MIKRWSGLLDLLVDHDHRKQLNQRRQHPSPGLRTMSPAHESASHRRLATRLRADAGGAGATFAASLAVALILTAVLYWLKLDGGGDDPPGCNRPGQLNQSLRIPAGATTLAANPCIVSWAGFAERIADAIPGVERGRASRFIKGLKSLTAAMDRLQLAMECGYSTEALAVTVYQDPNSAWPFGVAFGLDTGIDVLRDLAICYITDGLLIGAMRLAAYLAEPEYCHRSGPLFPGPQTVFWIGYTEKMCGALSTAFSTAELFATVTAKTGAKVRPMPSTRPDKSVEVRPAAAFTGVRCYIDGEPVNDSRRWLAVEKGYMHSSVLEISKDVSSRLSACVKPSPSQNPPSSNIVHASGNAKIRTGPSTDSHELKTAPDGSAGTALCYTTGGVATTDSGKSEVWFKVDMDGVTGYVSDLVVTHNSNITSLIQQCPIATPTPIP